MGTYLKAQKNRKKTVTETLIEAEEDHILDCPNAEISYRTAALILDLIFFILAYTGLKHLCDALNAHLDHLTILPLSETSSFLEKMIRLLATKHDSLTQILLGLTRITLGYFYFIWSLAYAGGSPGKLLLGLRVVESKTGRLLGFPQAFVRELIGKTLSAFLLFYGFLLPFFRKDKKALHDLIFQTTVKKIRGIR